MRLLIIVVLAAAGYFGYNYYIENKADVDNRISALLGRATPGSEGDAAEAPTDVPGTSAPQAAPPGAVFESKIGGETTAEGGSKTAPPGTYYVVQRVSVMSNNGVKALSPGEKVMVLQRLGGGRMKVTTGKEDFEVKENQVTNDLDIAREAEKREFVARGGVL